jgi:hypothetical protein
MLGWLGPRVSRPLIEGQQEQAQQLRKNKKKNKK